MKGLLVEVNFHTGQRAGGIDRRSKNLVCCPDWQSIKDGLEVRLVIDGNVDEYRDRQGLVVLEDEAAIDAAIMNLRPPMTSYRITNEALMVESIRQKAIDLTDIDGDGDITPELYARGALGIQRVEWRPAMARAIADRYE